MEGGNISQEDRILGDPLREKEMSYCIFLLGGRGEWANLADSLKHVALYLKGGDDTVAEMRK
jgi:hypothetical protein